MVVLEEGKIAIDRLIYIAGHYLISWIYRNRIHYRYLTSHNSNCDILSEI